MKALSLDPELAEVHAALGALLWTDWDFSGAEKAMTRALELNPNYAEAHHMYAHLLLELGRIDEALRESQAFLALDPVSDAPMGHIVGHYAWARQYDDAIAWSVKLRQLTRTRSRGISARRITARACTRRSRNASSSGTRVF